MSGAAAPPNGKIERTAALLLGVVQAAAVGLAMVFLALAGPRLGAALGLGFAGPFLGIVLFAAACGALVLIFGPSRWMLPVFCGGMLLMHQHLSFFIVRFGGVEWHPREMLLFLFLAHALVCVLLRPGAIPLDAVHFCVAAYAAAYVLAAAVGLLYTMDARAIVPESRFPIFLAAYPAFLLCGANRAHLYAMLRVILVLAALVALASCAFFAYTFVFGGVINVQNAYGAFVQRMIGGRLLQSLRPNGHMYFEICFVVLAGLFCARGTRAAHRAAYAALMLLFAAAILVTMMRTAYVAVAISLALLALLALPAPLRAVVALLGTGAAAIAALAFGLGVGEAVAQYIPELEVSLRARVEEILGAWQVFLAHPLLGAGFGSSFEGFGYVAKSTQETYTQAEYQTLHNVWMYLLFKGGLIGVLLAALGIGGIALRGMIAMDAAADPLRRALLRGIVAAFVGQCVASLAMPRITYPEGHVFVALAALAVVVLPPENQESASSATITRPIDSPPSTLRNAAGAASRP